MEDKLCRMRVVVRVRPENKRECAGSFSSVVQVLDDQMLIFDPKEEDEFALFNGPALRAPTTRKRKDLRVPTTRKRKDLRFIFDTVFDGTASQADVYKASTQRLLQYLLQGINCTVFAYGATGAGKTHTMMGTKDEPGLMCLTLEELFQCVEQRQGDKSCTIAMSYLEVYNEQLSDLLVSNGPLTVYEDPQKGVGVKNLSMHKPKSVEELLQMLEKGNQNRTQHPTDTNASSSRSHALLQIYLKQEEHDPSLKHNVLISKLSLIDLAGSERALETKNSGQRMREGATINCSLLALGNCINALADSKSKKQHIPYRNSKLTRLLKDTLGGNCQTIMVAAISPSSASYEETYNTLNYASRAKDIKYMLKSNVLNSEKHISRYFKAYKDLKEEVTELKEKLSSYEVERKMEPIQPSVTNEPCSAQTLQLQNTMQNMFKQRCSLHRDRLHAQTQLKEMELRAYLRERDQERIRIFCSEESLDKATGKLERCIAASRTRCDYLEEQRRRAEDRLAKEDARLQRLQTDIAMSKVLWSNLTRGLVEEENLFLKGHLNHSMQLVALLEQDKEHTERLMRSLLHMARLQFNTLHSTGLAGSEESDAMTAVESLVKRMHGVAWADQDTVSPRTTSSESPLPRFSLVQFLTFPSSKLPHQQASSNLETRTETFTRLKRDLPVGMNTVPSVQKKYTTPFTKAPFVGHKRQISGLSPNYSPAVKRAKRQVLQDPQSPGHQRFPFCPRDNISHALDGVFPLPEEEIPCGIAPLNCTFTHDIEFASATFHEDEQLDDAQGMKENLKMPSQGDGSLKSWPQYHSFATSAQGKCKSSMNRASVSRESRVQMLSNGPPVNRLEKFRHFSAVSKATAHRVRTSQNEPKSRPAIRRLRYVAAIPSLHNLSTPKRNIVEAQKCRKTC